MSRTRIVGGKLNIKIGSDYTINALQGNINFKAKGAINEISQGTINYRNFTTPENKTELKVTKLEGPFNENWEKIEKIPYNEFSYFKATISEKVDATTKQNLKWAVKYQAEESEFRNIYSGGSIREENVIAIKYKPQDPSLAYKLEAAKFKLFAYFKSKSESSLDVEIGVYRFNPLSYKANKYSKELNKIYTKREDWGAKKPIFSKNRSYEIINSVTKKDFSAENDKLCIPKLTKTYFGIALHHSGNSGLNTMKKVQNEHLEEKERADIGYHFGIDLKGTIYEGRPVGVKGSHLKNYNSGVIGIVFLADFDHQFYDFDDDLTEELYSATIVLIKALKEQFSNIKQLGGHKEWKHNLDKQCPGEYGMKFIKKIRDKLKMDEPE